jgi:hypothetical protein
MGKRRDEMTYASDPYLVRQISNLSEQLNLSEQRRDAALKEYREIHAKEMEELQEALLAARERNIELRRKLLEKTDRED